MEEICLKSLCLSFGSLKPAFHKALTYLIGQPDTVCCKCYNNII